MATVPPPADQAADLLQKLSVDTQNKTIGIPDETKKPYNMATGILSDRSVSPLIPDFMDPTVCYLPSGYPSTAYYYSGIEGNEWGDYTRYVNPEGMEMTPGLHGAYGDNGSLMYHHGFGYTPYGPYSPSASPITLGHDTQLYGAQQYQYPTSYFQSLAPRSGPYPTAATAKGEMATSAAAGQLSLSVGPAKSKSNGIANSAATKRNDNGTAMTRAAYQNTSFNVNGSYERGALSGGIPASVYQDPRFGFEGLHSSVPWLENPYVLDGQNSVIGNGNSVPPSRSQHYRPHMMGLNHLRPMSGMNTPTGYTNRMYPSKSYSQYENAYRSGVSYGSNGHDTRTGGRGWMVIDGKYKPGGRGNGFYSYGNESTDGLNELNRGPRTKSSKISKVFTPVALAVKGQNIPLTLKANNEKSNVIPDREQYNRPDFPETYPDAKCFIIKSYSEDDVHKSIKYSIWASTPNGNKKLDIAYQEAQQKSGGCPVFLFFSVNTSGQFVGIAEMAGPVDFNKNVEYWQQDKWIGCFPVKWHIVKDVPNSLLKHITLENNENKPVTNSRDTQEVKLEQGLQVLKIFKNHTSKQCILDDFDFYEDRQKRIQEKKAKQQQFQRQNQVWEGKPSEEKNMESKGISNGEVKRRTSLEVASDLNQGTVSTLSTNLATENNSLGGNLKTVKPVAVAEKRHSECGCR